MGCTSSGIKVTDNNILPNPTGERLYPYKIATDSGKTFKYGYINKTDKIVIQPQYDYANICINGYYRVEINNKWGMLNSEGNQVIKPIYQNLSGLYEGLIAAEIDGKYGYVDIKGNTVIPFQFKQARNFSEGKANVYMTDNEFIDKKGNIIAKNLKYSCFNGFKDGYSTIIVNNKVGYIDGNFNIVIEPKYEFATCFVNGIALAGDDMHLFYLINKKGEKVREFPKGYTLDFRADINDEDLIPVIKDGKEGYMDMEGNLKIGCIFDEADMFTDGYTADGYATAFKDGKTCVIDNKGNIITDSLPKDHLCVGILGNLVIYNADKGTEYYTLTGKKVFSSIRD